MTPTDQALTIVPDVTLTSPTQTFRVRDLRPDSVNFGLTGTFRGDGSIHLCGADDPHERLGNLREWARLEALTIVRAGLRDVREWLGETSAEREDYQPKHIKETR